MSSGPAHASPLSPTLARRSQSLGNLQVFIVRPQVASPSVPSSKWGSKICRTFQLLCHVGSVTERLQTPALTGVGVTAVLKASSGDSCALLMPSGKAASCPAQAGTQETQPTAMAAAGAEMGALAPRGPHWVLLATRRPLPLGSSEIHLGSVRLDRAGSRGHQGLADVGDLWTHLSTWSGGGPIPRASWRPSPQRPVPARLGLPCRAAAPCYRPLRPCVIRARCCCAGRGAAWRAPECWTESCGGTWGPGAGASGPP